MPRRYYGGVSTGGGFAEGIQAGYGLVSDFQDRQLRREEKEAERIYNEARLGIERDEAKSLDDYRTRQGDLAATEAEGLAKYRLATTNQAAKDARDLAAYRKTQGETAAKQAETAGIQAGTSQFAQETLRQNQERDDKLNAAIELRTKTSADADENRRIQAEIEVNAADAINQIADYAQKWREGSGTYDPEVIKKLVELTKGSKTMDLSMHFGPEADYVKGLATKVTGIQAMIDGDAGAADAFNPEEFDRVINFLLESSNQVGVGRTIGASTHPNAPTEYQDGNWVVIGKKMFNPQVSEDGQSITMRVRTMIQNRETGEVTIYRAPLTTNRAGASEDVHIGLEDLHKALAGFMHLDAAMQDSRPIIEAALVSDVGGSKDYMAERSRLMGELQTAANDFPDQISPVANMTNRQLFTDEGKRDGYIRSAALTGYRSSSAPAEFENIESKIIAQAQSHAAGKELIKEASARGEELTPEDWLNISSMLENDNRANRSAITSWGARRFKDDGYKYRGRGGKYVNPVTQHSTYLQGMEESGSPFGGGIPSMTGR